MEREHKEIHSNVILNLYILQNTENQQQFTTTTKT